MPEDIALAAFKEAVRPRERVASYQWASGGKITIPNSAVSSRYDSASSPWFCEPLDYASTGKMHEGYIIAPTGSGKTTLFDIQIPYWIARDPGSILAIQETDPDADDYSANRLFPILDSCDEILPMLQSLGRFKRTKNHITFPHLELNVVGANLSSLQRISVRYLLGDECWRWKHGLMAEARARMHDRWNRVALWVSQGGWETQETEHHEVHVTELYDGWKTSDRRVWNFKCPQCGNVQPFNRANLDWVVQKNDAGDLDIPAIEQSVKYKCAHCDAVFDDTPINRRMLADSGRYVVTNPNHKPRVNGWTYNALTVYRIPWAEFAIAWQKAREASANGDNEPLRICIQKRLAEFWHERVETPDVAFSASDYKFSDYESGQMIDNEIMRFMTMDRQRDHRWAVVRAWRADGSSRLLFAGKVLTKEGCREIQQRYKVKDALTFEDGQYETGDVYDECVEYGWTALHGDGKQKTFLHTPRGHKGYRAFYSPVKRARAPHGGEAKYVFWGNEGVKDELVQLRAGGRRPPFEIAEDTPEVWKKHMVCEVKRGSIYVPTGDKQNHLWDCEAMGVAAAMMMRILSGVEEAAEEKAKEEKAS